MNLLRKEKEPRTDTGTELLVVPTSSQVLEGSIKTLQIMETGTGSQDDCGKNPQSDR